MDRERQRQTDRQTDRQMDRDRETDRAQRLLMTVCHDVNAELTAQGVSPYDCQASTPGGELSHPLTDRSGYSNHSVVLTFSASSSSSSSAFLPLPPPLLLLRRRRLLLLPVLLNVLGCRLTY